jgi:TRAP-type C4-dicarboxylate transport system permease small subunit
MERLRNTLVRPIEAIIAACMAVMLLLVFGNVVLRYAFNTGIAVSDELSRLLFVWMVFLGAAAALFEHAHLGVDSLVQALPRTGKVICFVLSNVLMLYATWLMATGTWKQFDINLGMTMPVMGISQAWFFAPLLVFTAISAGWFAFMILKALTGRIKDGELIGVRESEEEVDVEAYRAAADRKP